MGATETGQTCRHLHQAHNDTGHISLMAIFCGWTFSHTFPGYLLVTIAAVMSQLVPTDAMFQTDWNLTSTATLTPVSHAANNKDVLIYSSSVAHTVLNNSSHTENECLICQVGTYCVFINVSSAQRLNWKSVCYNCSQICETLYIIPQNSCNTSCPGERNLLYILYHWVYNMCDVIYSVSLGV